MNEQIKEVLSEFVKWLKLKCKLHVDDRGVSFKVRDIWWTSIGLNIGSEQNGKNDNFERPVLVLRKFGQQVFFGIPLTSKKKDAPYRFEFQYKKYYQDKDGVLQSDDREGILILNQLRAMSNKRLIRKAGVVSEADFNLIRQKIKDII